jgi:hypothetical protein
VRGRETGRKQYPGKREAGRQTESRGQVRH